MKKNKDRNIFQRVSHIFKGSSDHKAPEAEIPHVPPPIPKQGLNFFGMGIAPRILESLARIKFTVPTPIQQKAIPLALEGKDVIGVAQTGTGKTLAFCVPMYQRLAQISKNGLILVPTRELAMQVHDDFLKIGQSFGMRTVVLIGGAPMNPQITALRRNPRIIIATPGRLIDHLQRRNVSLSRVGMVVLDEADRMLDMGFAPQIDQVLQSVNRERQTMLFSATIPPTILRIASKYMRLPVNVEIAPSGTVAEKINQELYVVSRTMKLKLLDKIARQYHGSILIFTRTKHAANNIARKLRQQGHRSADIHSNRSLAQRKEALEGFKSGKYRILVATDIASRGIDVKGIELVVNYDIPDDPENYVHRIGRTGRIGHEGHAIMFATQEQRQGVKNIEKIINSVLPVLQHPEVPTETFFQPKSVYVSRRTFRRSTRSFRKRR